FFIICVWISHRHIINAVILHLEQMIQFLIFIIIAASGDDTDSFFRFIQYFLYSGHLTFQFSASFFCGLLYGTLIRSLFLLNFQPGIWIRAAAETISVISKFLNPFI